jgi:kumamolisin
MPQPRRLALQGSVRTAVRGHRIVGLPDPARRIVVTVLLRPRLDGRPLDWVQAAAAKHPRDRVYLTRPQFLARHGASPHDIAQVRRFARNNGLAVLRVHPARRTVMLSGPVSRMARAFGTELHLYYHPPVGVYRGRVGPLRVPGWLAPVVHGVFGLDDRPQARPHARYGPAAGGQAGFSPLEVARLYGFPAGPTGRGQTIGVIALGGGYRTTDLRAHFERLGIPQPRVTAVPVQGGRNRPAAPGERPSAAQAQLPLLLQVAGSVAPGADLVVYFAPSATDQCLLNAVLAAVHDQRHHPNLLVVGWGQAEASATEQFFAAMEEAFKAAAALGVTVCCSAGDHGASARRTDGLAHVEYPASSPNVLACGGTTLEVSDGSVAREAVWNAMPSGGATGGGVSDVLPLPAWQQHAHVPRSANPGGRIGRGVPDVAGVADPATGYSLLVNGELLVGGGTSAVAALYAGLLAGVNQELGHPVGMLTPLLYDLPQEAFRDVTQGDNGQYHARAGWDACSGLGVVVATRLLTALGAREPREEREEAEERQASPAGEPERAEPTGQPPPKAEEPAPEPGTASKPAAAEPGRRAARPTRRPRKAPRQPKNANE